MRKIRIEGFLGILLFLFTLICVGFQIEPFMSRLYVITDQMFWVLMSAYFVIKAVYYTFPREDKDE